MKKLLQAILAVFCASICLSACSSVSEDEPVNGELDNQTKTEFTVKAHQQTLQDEFLGDANNGVPLSIAAQGEFGLYNRDILAGALAQNIPSDIEDDPKHRIVLHFPPVCVFQALGCEPFAPFLGLNFAEDNHNEVPYPLVAEGGEIVCPVTPLVSGLLSMENYTLTDIYVQIEGKTVYHESQDDFQFPDGALGFVRLVKDFGAYKFICISPNNGGKPRTFWLKFTDPNCEYVYGTNTNNVYFQIEQKAAIEAE